MSISTHHTKGWLFIVAFCLSAFEIFAQSTTSNYTIPRHVPNGDGDVFSSISITVKAEEDESRNKLRVHVTTLPQWESYKYQNRYYSLEEINEKNALPDPHFDGFVFDREMIYPDVELQIVLSDGLTFNVTHDQPYETSTTLDLDLNSGQNHSINTVKIVKVGKNEHVYNILSHKLCNNQNNTNPTSNSSIATAAYSPETQATGTIAGNTGNSSGFDRYTYQDPNEILKSSASGVLNMLATESNDPRLKKVAQNYNNIRAVTTELKLAYPENMEMISKLEDYTLLAGVIAPFIMGIESKQKIEANLRQSDLQNLRNHDQRQKDFEKDILYDVLVVKEGIVNEYTKGNTAKLHEYYNAYMTLLNTPIALYKPQELLFNYYSDVNRDVPWQNNMQRQGLHSLDKYQYNITVGELYYGDSKNQTAKKALDELIFLSTNPATSDTEVMRTLSAYPLYKSTQPATSGGADQAIVNVMSKLPIAKYDRCDYQPYLYALNYAYRQNRMDLFEMIWNRIDSCFRASGNTVEVVKVSDKPGVQKKHLKQIGYFSRQLWYKGQSAMFNALSYSILKSQYDLLKGNPIDPNYTYDNVFFTFTAMPKGSAISNTNLLGISKDSQAYLLQLITENLLNQQEFAMRDNDTKAFLALMKPGMKLTTKYIKITDAEKAKEKNNYFSPTYYNEVSKVLISTRDYMDYAKGAATLSASISESFLFSEGYFNDSFAQDTKVFISKALWHNAWATYYRTGKTSQFNAYISSYRSNPYVNMEWLMYYGIPVSKAEYPK